MSKLFGMVAAAALFASVTAFAQNSSPSSSSDTASAPAAAPSDDSAKPEKPMHKHGHHHMSGMGGTDANADKLNACMSNATPTSQQESCLKSAAGTGNG
jgi:Spy/CpxP family protein refolding chaperone